MMASFTCSKFDLCLKSKVTKVKYAEPFLKKIFNLISSFIKRKYKSLQKSTCILQRCFIIIFNYSNFFPLKRGCLLVLPPVFMQPICCHIIASHEYLP